MFALVRYYVKTSLVFLLIGMTAGAWAIVARDFFGRPVPFQMTSAHGHLLLVGFLVMLVMGVSLWMFPRPAKGDERYSEGVAQVAYWVMTVSVVVRFAAEAAVGYEGYQAVRPLAAVGGLGELIGTALFIYNLWPRIRPAVRP